MCVCVCVLRDHTNDYKLMSVLSILILSITTYIITYVSNIGLSLTTVKLNLISSSWKNSPLYLLFVAYLIYTKFFRVELNCNTNELKKAS